MNQSVIKALQLMEYFKEHPELTLAELAELDKMPKPTAYRLISSLEASGFLVKTKNSSHDVKYRLGLKLLELGTYVAEYMDYRKIALPYMEQLNRELNEAVHLAILDGEEATYVEKVEGQNYIRLNSKVGGRLPLYAGSAPKLLLAFLDQARIDEILENRELRKFTENTVTDKKKLLKELEDIRKQGYSYSQAEYYADIAGFSFPIRNHRGDVIAALVVSAPIHKFTKENKIRIKEKMKEAASSISIELGYREEEITMPSKKDISYE
ncbi:IclR family transcriptional regulator [Planococcus sp. 1R117A]|uniref:IclR family transcriptional regulator n=1 Tax=Planococcus sp. 1R117A TaxID=3447020 RepID=UPI003EDC1702